MNLVQSFSGDAARLIAAGATKLSTVMEDGRTYREVLPSVAGPVRAEVLRLDGGALLAVYFPVLSELIVIGSEQLVEFAVRERLRAGEQSTAGLHVTA